MTPPLCRAKYDLEGGFLEGYICYVPTSNVTGIQTRYTHAFVCVIPKTIAVTVVGNIHTTLKY